MFRCQMSRPARDVEHCCGVAVRCERFSANNSKTSPKADLDVLSFR
jgi:hypothetical protein